jgi:hypothetical protein
VEYIEIEQKVERLGWNESRYKQMC